MNNKAGIAMIAGVIARGLAWILAAKFGVDAAEAQTHSATIINGLASVVPAILAIYWSIKSRKKLLATEPPQ